MAQQETIRCGRCGQEYSLSAGKIALYAERGFSCTNCGSHVAVPAPPAPAQPAATVLNYATPGARPGGPEGGPWRDGKFIVWNCQTPLPDRCIRCGCDAKKSAVNQELVWYTGMDLGSV